MPHERLGREARARPGLDRAPGEVAVLAAGLAAEGGDVEAVDRARAATRAVGDVAGRERGVEPGHRDRVRERAHGPRSRPGSAASAPGRRQPGSASAARSTAPSQPGVGAQSSSVNATSSALGRAPAVVAGGRRAARDAGARSCAAAARPARARRRAPPRWKRASRRRPRPPRRRAAPARPARAAVGRAGRGDRASRRRPRSSFSRPGCLPVNCLRRGHDGSRDSGGDPHPRPGGAARVRARVAGRPARARTASRSSSSATPTRGEPFAIPPPELRVRYLTLPGVAGPTAEAQPRLARHRGAAGRVHRRRLPRRARLARARCSTPPTGPDVFLQGRTAPDPDERHLLHGLARSVDVPGAGGLVRDLQHGLPARAARPARRLRRGVRLRRRGHRPRLAGDRGRRRAALRRARRSCGTRSSRGPLARAVADATRWRDLPAVVARHPGLREWLHRRHFWNREHMAIAIALAGAAAGAAGAPALAALAAVPYLSARINWREPHPRRIARALATLPAVRDLGRDRGRRPAAGRDPPPRRRCSSADRAPAPDLLARGPPGLGAPRARPRRGARPPGPRGHAAQHPSGPPARSSGPTASRSCAPGASRGSPGCTGTTSTPGRFPATVSGIVRGGYEVVHALYPVDGWSARLRAEPRRTPLRALDSRGGQPRVPGAPPPPAGDAAGGRRRRGRRERPLGCGRRTAAPLRARRPGRSCRAAWSRPTTPARSSARACRRCSARPRSTIRASAGRCWPRRSRAFASATAPARLVLAGDPGPPAGSRGPGSSARTRRPPPSSPPPTARASVTVLPSDDEAFGLVLVESLAAGTPGGRRALGRLPGDRRRPARRAPVRARRRRRPRARDRRGSRRSPPTRRPRSAAARTPRRWDWARVVERYEALYADALG